MLLSKPCEPPLLSRLKTQSQKLQVKQIQTDVALFSDN